MSSSNEYSLKEALDLFLTHKNYKKDILPYQVIDAYHLVVGTFISKQTASVRFSNGTLYVLISSAALRHELSYKKDYLIEEINKQLENNAVEKLMLT